MVDCPKSQKKLLRFARGRGIGESMRKTQSRQGEAAAGLSFPHARIETGGIAVLARLMNEADSISFFCGAGCAGGREELLALAERVQAPIAYTLAAKDVMEADNPLGIGMVGPLGWGDAGRALHNCDLLILWGTDFPFRNYLPQHGRVAQVDANPAALGRRVPICLGLVGDVGEVARALLPLIHRNRPEEHLNRSRARHGREVVQMHARLSLPPGGAINAAYLTRLVSNLAEPDAVFCIGLGTPLRWGARYLQAQRRQRLLSPAPGGALIGELVQARRSKAAEPGRQVIALCDDNMRETLVRELPALLHEGLAIKMLLYAHREPHPDELAGSSVLTMAEQAPAVVRRWLGAKRAALLAALVPLRDAL